MTTMAYAIGEPPAIMLYGCGEPWDRTRPWVPGPPDITTPQQPFEWPAQGGPVKVKPSSPSSLLDSLRAKLAEVRAYIQQIEADQAYLPALKQAEAALAAAVERKESP